LPLLRAEEVTVRFGGHAALTDISLDAEAATVTGLIGPNGAGKTTCFNVLNGLQPPNGGRVFFEDVEISNVPAFKRGRLGIARTFQRLEVFGSLTVLENVLVGAEIKAGWGRKPDGENPRDQAEAIVDLVGLRSVADQRVDAIPTGPRLVLLDEPSSGLDDDESEAFGDLLIALAKRGLAILIVEHDIDLVMKVCDHIHVLEFGHIIARGTPAEIRKDKAVQAAYLGTEGAA
jgi:branched-chain amino acid transport system ATP-binding protein